MHIRFFFGAKYYILDCLEEYLYKFTIINIVNFGLEGMYIKINFLIKIVTLISASLRGVKSAIGCENI